MSVLREPAADGGASAEHAPIDLRGEQVLVLLLDPACVAVPRLEADVAWVVGEGRAAIAGPGRVLRLPREAVFAAFPDAALAAAAPRHAVVVTLRGLSVAAVLAAARLGVRTFHLVEPAASTFACDVKGALRVAALRGASRGAAWSSALVPRATGLRLDPPWPTLDGAARAADLAVDLDRERATAHAPGGPARRVVQVIGTLGAGGAEGQLVLVAGGLTARGSSQLVLTLAPLEGELAHNAARLRAAGVTVEQLVARSRLRAARPLVDLEGRALPLAVLEAMERHPAGFRALGLLDRLLVERPDAVHGWLDESGLIAGLAAVLAGVPRIVIGGRNLCPVNFPWFHQPWFRATYQALARSPRVTLTNNTRAGAVDYARWLGLPLERILVVPNGVSLDAVAPIPAAERRARRAEAGLADDAFLVVGMFRLSPEKRPQDFLRAVARAAEQVPSLVAWHVGDGPEADATREAARALGLTARVRFHGRLEAPWRLAGLADASLLASAQEGLPNVVIESQAAGVPPVITDAGGAVEAVEPGRTALVSAVGDIEGLAAALVSLARDPARRAALAAAGRSFVLERLSERAVVDAHERLYSGRPPGPATLAP